jgi:hypothetical protein
MQPRRLTYSELAAACLRQFGPERTWNAETLRRYWHDRHRIMKQSPIENDGEVLAFLRERAGRLSVAEILTECRARYAADRVPSRSATYRWLSRERRRLFAQPAPGTRDG